MEVEQECYDEDSVAQLELFHRIHAIGSQYATVHVDELPNGLTQTTLELILQSPLNYETALIAIPELRQKPSCRPRNTFLDDLLRGTCNHRPTRTAKYSHKEYACIAIGASTAFIKIPEIDGAIRLPVSITEEDLSDASTEINSSESVEQCSQDQGNSDSDKENSMPIAPINQSQTAGARHVPIPDPGINPARRNVLTPVYRPLSPPDLSDEDEPGPAIPHTPPQISPGVMVYEDGAEFGPFQILASNTPTRSIRLVTFVFYVVCLCALSSTDGTSVEIAWVVDDRDITLEHVDYVLVAFTGRPGKYALVHKNDFQMDDAGVLERMTPEEAFLEGKKESMVDRLIECSVIPGHVMDRIGREAQENFVRERAEINWMYEHIDEVIAKLQVA